MDGRMEGWMDGQTDGRTDARTDGWMDACLDGWMDEGRDHLGTHGSPARVSPSCQALMAEV
eukprot:scaffold249735_cov34-Prasinocladus_malaysianus.AAC.1